MGLRNVPDVRRMFLDKLKKIAEYIKSKMEVFGPFSIRLFLGLAFGMASLFAFVDLSEDVYHNEVAGFDNVVTGFVRQNISDKLTEIMKTISNIASPTVITIIAVILILYFIYRQKLYTVFIIPTVVLGSLFLNLILKGMFGRERPSIEHLVEAMGQSYPSGHSMVSFSFYGLLIYLACINLKNIYIKVILSMLLGLLILSIGTSRIYLGVHYPSDVLAGFAIGSFWLIACIYGFGAFRNRGSNK